MTMRMNMGCRSEMLCGYTLPPGPEGIALAPEGSCVQFTDPSLLPLGSPVQTGLNVWRAGRDRSCCRSNAWSPGADLVCDTLSSRGPDLPGVLLCIPGCVIRWVLPREGEPRLETLLRLSVVHDCS